MLGHFPARAEGEEEEQAVLLLEKTHFEPSFYSQLGQSSSSGISSAESSRSSKEPRTANGAQDASSAATVTSQENGSSSSGSSTFFKLSSLGQNDIYHWLLGWTAAAEGSPADVKLSLIRPATAAVSHGDA